MCIFGVVRNVMGVYLEGYAFGLLRQSEQSFIV